MAGRVPITVHVGACALAEALRLARHAREVGVLSIDQSIGEDGRTEFDYSMRGWTTSSMVSAVFRMWRQC